MEDEVLSEKHLMEMWELERQECPSPGRFLFANATKAYLDCTDEYLAKFFIKTTP